MLVENIFEEQHSYNWYSSLFCIISGIACWFELFLCNYKKLPIFRSWGHRDKYFARRRRDNYSSFCVCILCICVIVLYTNIPSRYFFGCCLPWLPVKIILWLLFTLIFCLWLLFTCKSNRKPGSQRLLSLLPKLICREILLEKYFSKYFWLFQCYSFPGWFVKNFCERNISKIILDDFNVTPSQAGL